MDLDLRELVSAAAHDVVLAKVTGMLADGASVTKLQMRRAALKPKLGLRAAYTVRVRSPAGGSVAKRYLSVFWLIDRPKGGPAEPDPEVPPALAGPFRRLRVFDPNVGPSMGPGIGPGIGIDIRAWPYDPGIPLLAQAAHPQFAAALVASLTGGTGHPGAWTVTPVRYVPERTHVLRYDPPAAHGSPGPETMFAKLYRDASATTLVRDAMTRAAAAFADGAGPAALNSPVPGTDLDGFLLFPWVEGASLASRLGQPAPDIGAVLAALGTAVAALHRLAPHPDLPERSLAWVIRGTARAAPWLELLAPHEAGRFDRLLEAVTAAGERRAAEGGVLSHGDLKAEHALVTDAGQLSLIDLDSLARAEPALDLGQLLADLRWQCRPHGDAFIAAAQDRFLDGYRSRAGLPPDRLRDRLRRARVFEVATFLRTVARRVSFWQPGWEAALAASLDAAEQVAREFLDP